MISKGFQKKLLNTMFKEINLNNWFSELKFWLTDSKFRTYKRLDKFLANQPISDELQKVALDLEKKYPEFDERIIEIIKFVTKKVNYAIDQDTYGKLEFWAEAYKVYSNERDDCDGINSLIHVLALLSGVPNELLYSTIGNTMYGGHYYLIYLSPKTGKIYSIDGTYFVDKTKIVDRKPFVLNKDKYTKIWYVFNPMGVWKSNV